GPQTTHLQWERRPAHLTQHFALQKGVKTRNPRELTSVSAGVEGRKQRIGSVKGAPHLTQHFALHKCVKTRHPRELTSVSDRG
ncbi:TPA: hypothetical protein ACGTVG_001304, partial [Klebsiella pneumoniae]